MWGDSSMRFIVKTDNDENSAKKLQSFNPEFLGQTLTIELNSWHAFSDLLKKFKTAPVVYNQRFGSQGSKWKTPMLDFRTRKYDGSLRYGISHKANTERS